MKWHYMKILVLIFLLPICTFAQTLKPGVYRDLKADKPIVLVSGSYTFINLEMKNLGKGIWLDGRKARKIEMQNCRFEGNGSGTAVESSGDLQVRKCIFENLEEAIVQHSPKGSVRKVSVVSNQFRDNGVSIRLSAQEDKRFAAGLKMHHGAHVLRSEVRDCKSRTAEEYFRFC